LNWHIGEYDSLLNDSCFVLNINEESRDLLFHIYPNPATSMITIKYNGSNIGEQIQIYNSIGVLIKEVEISHSTQIDISGLSDGLYFIHLKNLGCAKFITTH
jgi:hypothetical protein